MEPKGGRHQESGSRVNEHPAKSEETAGYYSASEYDSERMSEQRWKRTHHDKQKKREFYSDQSVDRDERRGGRRSRTYSGDSSQCSVRGGGGGSQGSVKSSRGRWTATSNKPMPRPPLRINRTLMPRNPNGPRPRAMSGMWPGMNMPRTPGMNVPHRHNMFGSKNMGDGLFGPVPQNMRFMGPNNRFMRPMMFNPFQNAMCGTNVPPIAQQQMFQMQQIANMQQQQQQNNQMIGGVNDVKTQRWWALLTKGGVQAKPSYWMARSLVSKARRQVNITKTITNIQQKEEKEEGEHDTDSEDNDDADQPSALRGPPYSEVCKPDANMRAMRAGTPIRSGYHTASRHLQTYRNQRQTYENFCYKQAWSEHPHRDDVDKYDGYRRDSRYHKSDYHSNNPYHSERRNKHEESDEELHHHSSMDDRESDFYHHPRYEDDDEFSQTSQRDGRYHRRHYDKDDSTEESASVSETDSISPNMSKSASISPQRTEMEVSENPHQDVEDEDDEDSSPHHHKRYDRYRVVI